MRMNADDADNADMKTGLITRFFICEISVLIREISLMFSPISPQTPPQSLVGRPLPPPFLSL